MTRFTAFAAALLMTAGAASAQVTTQAAVGGDSGVAALPTLAKHLPKSMASLHVVASIQAPLVALALKA